MKHLQSNRGYALLPVVIISGILLMAGVATLQLTRSELHFTADHMANQRAFYVADAGVQRGLAQLDLDRTTAGTSTAYSYATTEAFDGGSYTVAIAQDPLYPADASRKQIQSTGSALNGGATIRAHALVQNVQPASICFADTGSCRLLTAIGGATQLFNGNIHSNTDVRIGTTAGVAVNAAGNVVARRDFYDASTLALSVSNLSANLFRGGNFIPGGVHIEPACVLFVCVGAGLHFNNGIHGVSQSTAQRPFPLPDWERLRREANVVVNADNVPFGSWNAASQTWSHTGLLSFPADASTFYFVEGNVDFLEIQLAKGASVTIAGRGAIRIRNVTVLGTGLIANSTQTLRLIGEDDVVIGQKLLDAQLGTLASIGVGLGSTAVAIAHRNRVFAYSEKADVWVNTLNVGALTDSRVSLIAKQTATLAQTAGTVSTIRVYE